MNTLTDAVRAAVRAWWESPEVAGPAKCPLFWRWTIARTGSDAAVLPDGTPSIYQRKLLLHRFLPNMLDVAPAHDHPWPFWTFVVRGRYEDMTPCSQCRGAGCTDCNHTGVGRTEMLRAPTMRHRPANYTHVTRTDHRGAWTIVLTGRVCRRWGYWRDRQWWWYKDYEKRYGQAMRCDD